MRAVSRTGPVLTVGEFSSKSTFSSMGRPRGCRRVPARNHYIACVTTRLLSATSTCKLLATSGIVPPAGDRKGQGDMIAAGEFDPRRVSSINGGDEETRTPDPLLAKEVLSQLSYIPMRRLEIQSSGY